MRLSYPSILTSPRPRPLEEVLPRERFLACEKVRRLEQSESARGLQGGSSTNIEAKPSANLSLTCLEFSRGRGTARPAVPLIWTLSLANTKRAPMCTCFLVAELIQFVVLGEERLLGLQVAVLH